jgi:hypothetical protein
MNRVYDCFLYNNERELLALRLQLLAGVVHKFVIVWSRRTFTGLKKSEEFPRDVFQSLGLQEKVELIELDELEGKDAWEKEAFSRNALARGIADARPADLIMVSDVDEIPRPSVLAGFVQTFDYAGAVVLALDYYNFKLNYQLVHGLQAVWAGPVVCRRKDFRSAQALREERWRLLDNPSGCVEDSGWHFSFLTTTGEVAVKLASFSHQEKAIQDRRTSEVGALIASRQGFHDHLYPGSVWAVVALSSFRCASLERLVETFPELLVRSGIDEREGVDRGIRHAVRRICDRERTKMLGRFEWHELVAALCGRLNNRVLGAFRKH